MTWDSKRKFIEIPRQTSSTFTFAMTNLQPTMYHALDFSYDSPLRESRNRKFFISRSLHLWFLQARASNWLKSHRFSRIHRGKNKRMDDSAKRGDSPFETFYRDPLRPNLNQINNNNNNEPCGHPSTETRTSRSHGK